VLFHPKIPIFYQDSHLLRLLNKIYETEALRAKHEEKY